MINLERFISNACCNSCQNFYDLYVEANVRFRSQLGMRALIIRRQLNNCCDWCAERAGIYDPYNAPDGIYKRHENCRCLVTYKTEAGYQNVWSKEIYQTQRNARIKQIHDYSTNVENIDKFEIEKRELLSEGKKIYDATSEWESMAKPNNVTIKSLHRVYINGIEYIVDGDKIRLDLRPEEIEVLEKLVRKYGGIMEYHPRVLFPNGINTPDCIFNGMKYDLKQPGLNMPGIIGDDVLFRKVKESKVEKQAHCFIFDITRTGLSREDAINQAYKLFFRDKTKYIERVVLYDGEFFKVLERIEKNGGLAK